MNALRRDFARWFVLPMAGTLFLSLFLVLGGIGWAGIQNISSTSGSSNPSTAAGWVDNGTDISLQTATDNVVVQSTLSVTGNAFSVGASSFTVAGGSATVAYSMTAARFLGDGSGLSNLPSAAEGNTFGAGFSSKTFTVPVNIVDSTLTVGGNAFSVGGTTMSVANGEVSIGTTTRYIGAGRGVQIVEDGRVATFLNSSVGAASTNDMRTYSSSLAQPSAVRLFKAQGSIDVPTSAGDNSQLGAINAVGYTGAANASAATIRFETDKGVGSGSMPASIKFLTVPTGSVTLQERAVITSSGDFVSRGTMTVEGNAFSVGVSTLVVKDGMVGIGTTSPASTLSVAGAANLYPRTKAQLSAITPVAGDIYLCSDCTYTYDVCVATGATLSGFRAITNSGVAGANKGCGVDE